MIWARQAIDALLDLKKTADAARADSDQAIEDAVRVVKHIARSGA